MKRSTMMAALAGALTALTIVAALAALDRAVLHVYSEDKPSTRWYYIDEEDAGFLTRRFGVRLPACNSVLRREPPPIPASSGDPRFHSGRVLVECRR